MAPMLGVLGEDSSGSEDKSGGDASPPREGEAIDFGLRRPAPGLDEVLEDEVEASCVVALALSVELQRIGHHAEDVGGSGAILSPLHLGEFLSSSCFSLLLMFRSPWFNFLSFRGIGEGPWEEC